MLPEFGGWQVASCTTSDRRCKQKVSHESHTTGAGGLRADTEWPTAVTMEGRGGGGKGGGGTARTQRSALVITQRLIHSTSEDRGAGARECSTAPTHDARAR
ncbi:unnamed protein product [Danaus chrysippus]|uniref:(African queen) hypothetical protein n=1 Tax=Danaus chrysippus TaxID=151541 RepID=A0A8J2QH42_9NEOP|nr:unnamed protein product [Danaus chrysippus]